MRYFIAFVEIIAGIIRPHTMYKVENHNMYMHDGMEWVCIERGVPHLTSYHTNKIKDAHRIFDTCDVRMYTTEDDVFTAWNDAVNSAVQQ